MKKLSYILIFFVLILFSSIGTMKYEINSRPSASSSIEREEAPKTSAISPRIATKDTFVDEQDPNDNKGDSNVLWSGWNGGWYHEAYFYFSLSSLSASWSKAELSVAINPNSFPVLLTACIIETNWDESQMTWNNKPAHGANIDDINVTKDLWNRYRVDVSTLLSGRSYISICIYIDLAHANPDIGSVYIIPRDYWQVHGPGQTPFNRPQIIFDGYYGPAPVTSNNGNDDDGDNDVGEEFFFFFNLFEFVLSPIGLVIIGGSITGAIATAIIVIKRASGKAIN